MSENLKDQHEQDIETRIFQAALFLFAKKGYAATSIREIVTRANVTNPMVYYYFGNKEGLFHGLLKVLQDHFYTTILSQVRTAGSIEEICRTIAVAHFGGLQERPDVFRFVYAVLYGPHDSFPTHTMVADHKVMETEIVTHVSKYLPTENQAAQLVGLWFSLVNSVSMHCLLEFNGAAPDKHNDIFDLHCGSEALDQLIEFLLRGTGIQGE